jgi:peptide/nickel transport system substrate-binding protein
MRVGLFIVCFAVVGNVVVGLPALAADSAEPETLVEPFDPPTLADIDRTAEWIDQPVLDALDLLRDLQADEKPLATPDEALALRNESPDDNAKILSALGRLPPSASAVDWESTIVRHLGGDVKSTNPIMGSSSAEFEVSSLTSFGLFSFDWNFKPFASKDTVVSWQTSKDRLMDKVVIRDDLTWSDGKPITAHDVEFSFFTIMNPRIPIPAVRSGTDQLKWVKAYDDHTVIFFHKESLATNVWNINFPVIPKHIYEKSIADDYTMTNSEYHARYEREPISGGPFKFVSRTRGEEILLERRDDYYKSKGKQVRDKPYFKRVRFRVLQDSNTTLVGLKKGDIDEAILSPEQWQTQTSNDDFYRLNTKASGVEWVYYYFAWNMKTPFFSDVRVRKAMSYTVDYDELLNVICYGLYQQSNGLFYPTAWMAPKDPPLPYYKQDLDKAIALLEEAGWTDSDGDGLLDREVDGRRIPFEFSLLCSSTPLGIAVAALMKQNLDQIGILCNVRPLEFAVFQQKTQAKEFQAMFGGWGTGTDPESTKNIWKTGEGRNYVSFSSAEVDQLYDQGEREFDRDKRAAIYAKIDELIYAEQPYTWLFLRSSFYGFNKRLRGYKFSPRGPFSYSPGFSSVWKVPAAE